jgi:PEP-CTERM motif
MVEMDISRILGSAGICAALLVGLGAKADAAVVPVVDPYFNMFPTVATNFDGFMVGPGAPHPYLFFGCGTGCAFADDNIVGWSATSTFKNPGISGQWQTGVPQTTNTFKTDPLIDGVTPEPIVARVINAAISQVVSTTAVVGATYTLDVDLGFSLGQADNGSVILVVNGHQVVATAAPSAGLTVAQMQNTGNWYDFEASYTATAADANAPIEILLSSFTNGFGFAYFGNVRLTDSLDLSSPVATPEPATWAMMLLGFGGMAGVAAVRRRSSRRPSAVSQLA